MHHFCTLSLCGPCERVLLTSVTTDPVLFKLGGWNMWPGGNSFYDGDCACAKWVVVAVGRCKPINWKTIHMASRHVYGPDVLCVVIREFRGDGGGLFY
jgi:hypothetical protein